MQFQSAPLNSTKKYATIFSRIKRGVKFRVEVSGAYPEEIVKLNKLVEFPEVELNGADSTVLFVLPDTTDTGSALQTDGRDDDGAGWRKRNSMLMATEGEEDNSGIKVSRMKCWGFGAYAKN